MKEVWKDIKGFEGFYQVSNLGNIKSLDRYILYSNGTRHFHSGKILTPTLNKYGYYYVHLKKEGKKTFYLVHRLVAENFISNFENYNCINHKDENPKNNKVTNLEWCSYKYNNNYGNHNKKLSMSKRKQVIQLSHDNIIIRYYDSIREAEAITGVAHSSISACCKNKMKYAGGYIWKYI
jgi:uncharacterized protein (UPF0128 family)